MYTPIMRVYLDHCCFNRPYDNQGTLTVRLETEAKLHIQDAIRVKRYTLGWSYILDYENAANPFEERRTEIQRWKAVADSFAVETPAILGMMKACLEVGLKPLDALHIACAQALECQYFLTVDQDALKRARLIKKIRVLNPIDFVVEQGL